MKILYIAYCIIIGCSGMSYAQQTVLQGKGKIVLEPFGYGAVKLTGGPLRRQLDDVKNYYLQIPNDGLLKGFRERMHFPTWGAIDLGGWYDGNFCHVFGQILAGLSRLYAVTGDEACRDKVNALVDGWAQCIDSTGYFFYRKNPVTGHYVYEKVLGGLLDAYQFAGNKKALACVSRITDWSMQHLSMENNSTSAEWYTLTQNLYRAYLITGDKKYLEYGNHWEYSAFWNALSNKKDVFPITRLENNSHAYSHLNSLSGAGEAYLVKGDQHYLTTLKNGYDLFINKECFATGGFGPNESLLPTKAALVKALRTTHNTFETQCGSWAVFKLCKYLLMITGNGKYGNWIEKLMINGIGASIPMSADGRVMYYSDYNPREGTKSNIEDAWSCCTGTRPEAVAEYAHLIYFKDHAGIYVNIYTPSTVTWNGVTLTQTTRFPESDEMSFKIKTSSPHSFTLHFRKPSWLKRQPKVFVNGKEVKATLSNNWYQIKRQWKNGDHIKLVLPMNFAVSRLDTSQKYPAAITYGPVVLAIRSGDFPYPAGLLESPDPWKNFIPVAGAPLNFHVKGNPNLLIRPYYEFKANEPYIIYIDPKVKNEIRYSKIKTRGDWHGKGRYSNETGATVATTFSGTGIKFKAKKFDNAGMLKVEIDNKPVDTLDLYAPIGGIPFERNYGNLKAGKHRIVLTLLSGKNSASKGNYVNYAGFEKLPE